MTSLISKLQSRIDLRADKIASMEWDYMFFKMKAQASGLRADWKVVRGVREAIKPLAKDQKLDRMLMTTLPNLYYW